MNSEKRILLEITITIYISSTIKMPGQLKPRETLFPLQVIINLEEVERFHHGICKLFSVPVNKNPFEIRKNMKTLKKYL